MSDYALRAMILCPEAMMSDANALALVVGERAGDAATFRAADWVGRNGDRYAVAGTLARAAFAAVPSQVLKAPDHAPDADLAAARRAQAALEVDDGTRVPAPDVLLALVLPVELGWEPHRAALAGWALERAPGVHLNRDTAARLQALQGVGPALAQRIVEGRPWKAAQDLASVEGIVAARIALWEAVPGLAI